MITQIERQITQIFKAGNFFVGMILILCMVTAKGFCQNSTADNTNTSLMGANGIPKNKSGYKIGPGMESVQFGEVSVLVPKGAKVRREGGQIIFEDMSEFVGRKLDDIEQRFLQSEKKQEELKSDIEKLKSKTVDLEKQLNELQEKKEEVK